MKKKHLVAILIVAAVIVCAALLFTRKDTPAPSSTATSSSTSESTSMPAPESDNQFTISTFTAEVEYYKTTKGIAKEDKIPKESLEDLYSHLKHIAKIDPNIVENEDNEYFPGYLEWYNTKAQEEENRGLETDVVPPEIQQQQEELNQNKDEKFNEIMQEIASTHTPEEMEKLTELCEYKPSLKSSIVSAKRDLKDFNRWINNQIKGADLAIENHKDREALKQADTSGKDKEFFEQHGH